MKRLVEWFLYRPLIGWWGGGAILAILAGLLVLDRQPPIQLTGQYSIPEGYAGQEITFEVPAAQSERRSCRSDTDRYIRDPSGARRAFEINLHNSAEGLEDQIKAERGVVKRTIVLPATLPQGTSFLLSEISYTCLLNPTTWLWPIDVYFKWEFVVLPPKPVDSIVIITPRIPEAPQAMPAKP